MVGGRTLRPRERTLILATLLALAAAAWVVVIAQATMAGEMAMGAASPTMGLAAPLFLAIWIVMMVAMMFPTAAPMILTFAAIAAGKRQRGQPHAPTWVFVGAYLLVWSLFGGVAYGLALALERLAMMSPWVMDHLAQIGGAVLILAGLYQLSPLKHACLSHCRAPASFLARHWRPHVSGALRLGALHGGFCVGCCWMLMALLFVGGVMNLGWIAALAVLVLVEKVLPAGRWVGRAAGAALISWGIATLLV